MLQRNLEMVNPGHRIGDFELIRELGSGGMGTVWEWTQIDFYSEWSTRSIIFYRGGGFTSTSAHARTAHRHYAQEDFFSPYIGLRPARPIENGPDIAEAQK